MSDPVAEIWSALAKLSETIRDAVVNGVITVPNGDQRTLGQFIADERAKKGVSLQDVADKSGLTKSHVWEFEKGRSSNPTLHAMRGLAKALDVPFVALCAAAERGS